MAIDVSMWICNAVCIYLISSSITNVPTFYDNLPSLCWRNSTFDKFESTSNEQRKKQNNGILRTPGLRALRTEELQSGVNNDAS